MDSTVADDKVEPGSVVEDGERVDGVQPENVSKQKCKQNISKQKCSKSMEIL